MSLEHALLGLLTEEPATGYDLKTKYLDDGASHFWRADQAQVYRTLGRLRQRRLVTSKLVPQRGKPDRKVFSITERGRSELASWLSDAQTFPPERDAFLAQLFFAAGLDDDSVLDLLRQARERHQKRLDSLRGKGVRDLVEWVRRTGRERDGVLRKMTLDARIASIRTGIDWLDDCIDAVRAGLPPEQGRLSI